MDNPPMCTSSPMYIGSPDPQNNVSLKKPISATLRERLKKCRRSFSSTCSVAKRLKVDGDESDSSLPKNVQNNSADTGSPGGLLIPGPTSVSEDGPKLEASPSKPDVPACNNHQEMVQEKKRLLKRIQEKEEHLRRLKMVKLYRSKNNLEELQSLIDKWRESSQLLLPEIQKALSTANQKITLTQLIENCGLDEKLLRYNRAEEDFDA
ncbi:swi5-dependent recombination DNA repair protein 1 homolog [Hyla sarda]|uniref:swi5-dependent recombination DNA repair protein 1 homolog n=1 Tax=Hyla sarda TaxID=327740 RepID=UPI0024C2C1D5|nr:swi5-dependent recombination DNA repair protein 1 homolog [Hyla sarda]XP_056385166.1 swi5-dependent recombination DNA repair protein 1 homolog [Hyla sarda]XP_056385167.1 swi5-dependent recombination DNA repair protein 1 homolog [Hyla sarda]XP_056385168.1 swi5-dependent recombination DNA repair protein 1 homolog [Hyla sarda]XP_056385169.1 swi5-dependent recombination DNA repair protein 1 homolog [Hyla sarda]XP_056385170.1 swi5-dependent recombination DNA repair protein 1 homolog [Hyla sarda]